MNLTRKQLLDGSYIFPKDLVELWPTKHFVERLEQRGIGLDCVPTVVRVTKDNVHSAKSEGNKLTSVVVRLVYGKYKYIFLCFDPNDGGLKTLWFKEKGGYNGSGRRRPDNQNSRQTIRDIGSETKILGHP